MRPTAVVCLDDSQLSNAVRRRLEQLGWSVGSDFTSNPDLVLLDARADYLLKALKADARTAQLSVVAVGSFERKAACLAAGALAFLSRPIDLEAFDALTSFIEHGRSGAAQGHPNKSLARPAPDARV